MRTAETILNIILDRGKRKLPLDDVYRQLYNPDFYLRSYAKMYKNAGAMTPGTTGETVDGMSLGKIDRVKEAIRYERWNWPPVRRDYIDKPKGGKRPLGIPDWSPKVVQDIVRSILEAYYEPQFSDHSHGFRPKRGCQSALTKIHNTWNGTKWFIEGDIKGCFEKIDHHLLMNILRENIQDNRFLRLIEGVLKAGYCEEWTYHPTLSGTPQGGIITPPTKLQTFFFEVRIARVRIDSKDDIDLVLGYFDPLHEGPDEVPFVRPIRSLQAVVDVGRKVFQTANDQLQFCVHGRLICQLLALLLQTGDTLAQAGQPGLKFGLVDEPLRVTVD